MQWLCQSDSFLNSIFFLPGEKVTIQILEVVDRGCFLSLPILLKFPKRRNWWRRQVWRLQIKLHPFVLRTIMVMSPKISRWHWNWTNSSDKEQRILLEKADCIVVCVNPSKEWTFSYAKQIAASKPKSSLMLVIVSHFLQLSVIPCWTCHIVPRKKGEFCRLLFLLDFESFWDDHALCLARQCLLCRNLPQW